MTTTPQAVTERYVTNLINYGRNREFDIECIRARDSTADNTDVVVGIYFEATICHVNDRLRTTEQKGYGASISQAVRNALIKHGVTFR